MTKYISRAVLILPISVLAICLLCSTTYIYPEVCRSVISDKWTIIIDEGMGGNMRDEARIDALAANIALVAVQLWPTDPWAQDYSYNDEGEYGNPSSIRYSEDLDFISNRTLIDGYSHELGKFYANPYTASGMEDYDARLVPFGWTPDAVGNFSYLKQYAEDGAVCCFMLVGWGPDPDAGLDLDGDGEADGAVAMMASWHIRNLDAEFINAYSLDKATELIPISDSGRDFVLQWHGELYPWEAVVKDEGE